MQFKLPKSQEIFRNKSQSSDVFEFQGSNQMNSLYSAYFSTSDPLHVICLELLASAGLLMAFCGYRFLKFAMFCCGFILAFSAFYIFSPMFIHTSYCCSNNGNKNVHVGVSILVGIIIGLLISRLYHIGVFFIGKALGLLVALITLQTPIGIYFKSNASVAGLLALMAMLFGSLATKFEKPFVIVSTSLLGSYIATCGIDVFLKSSFSFAVFGFIIYFKEILQAGMHSRWHIETASLPHLQLSMTWLNKRSLSLLAAWIGLSVISCFIQCKVTAKDLQGGGHICPFNFKSCLCECCEKGEQSKEEKEILYLFRNEHGFSHSLGKKK